MAQPHQLWLLGILKKDGTPEPTTATIGAVEEPSKPIEFYESAKDAAR